LYACHIAAMAPATNLGAATPVQIAGLGGGGDESDKESKRDSSSSHMMQKVTNDAVAYIRGLAQLRGRNPDWAEKAVREAASLSADAALQNHVIDLIAKDVPDLLAKIDGRAINVLGEQKILATRDLAVSVLEPDWRVRLLGIITDPNIAYI